MAQAKAEVKRGDIVETSYEHRDITRDNRYYVKDVTESEVIIVDDIGDAHAVPKRTVIIVGNLQDYDLVPYPTLKDILGQNVRVGDFVAYADNVTRQHGLGVFEITQIDRANVAHARDTQTGNGVMLGVLPSRGLKLKDYNK